MRLTRSLLLPVLVIALAVVPAASAQAGLLVESAGPCEDRTLEQPFKRWLDPASYVLVAGGTFESAGHGWSLSQASRVTGN